MAMLEVDALRTGYGDTEILRGVALRVMPGEVVAVLGPNGAGKTTLNLAISGLLASWAGSIRFRGEEIAGKSPQNIVAAGLVQVPEGRKIFPNLSVTDNLRLGSYRRGRTRRERNLSHVLDLFPPLRERLEQPAGSLSGGEQQMLAIGRGLMAEPELMILDEPSLGLAPVMVETLFALIEQLQREGPAILLVEQNVVRSLEVAGRAYVLDRGRISLAGDAAELARNEQIEASYLGM